MAILKTTAYRGLLLAACLLAWGGAVAARAEGATLAYVDQAGGVCVLEQDRVQQPFTLRPAWLKPDGSFPTEAYLQPMPWRAVERGLWQAPLPSGPECDCRLTARLRPEGEGLSYDVEVACDRPPRELTPALRLQWPLDAGRGGLAVLQASGDWRELPRVARDRRTLFRGPAGGVAAWGPADAWRIQLTWPGRPQISLEEGFQYRGMRRQAALPLAKTAEGRWQGRVDLRFRAATAPGRAVVSLANDPPGGPFAGFGGTFVFRTDSPVSGHNLANLRPVWARVRLGLAPWCDLSPGTDPADQDRSGSPLNQDLETWSRLARAGIPLMAGIWELPAWAYRTAPGGGRAIDMEAWPRVARAAVRLLVYAADRYGAEPRLLSLNEPNLGPMKLEPEQYRTAVSILAKEMQEYGLATRLLLGDVSHPWGSVEYLRPALADPYVKSRAGGLCFHSWDGAPPREYERWREAARKAGLPLFVSELGLYANAWRDGSFDAWPYALAEMRLRLEALNFARPLCLLQWEYSDDYPLVNFRQEAGRWLPAETDRYHLLRQMVRTTPRPAVYLNVGCDRELIRAAALSAPQGPCRGLALHLGNSGPERLVEVRGLAACIRGLKAVLSDGEHAARALPTVPVRDGRAVLTLPAQSLVSLSWP